MRYRPDPQLFSSLSAPPNIPESVRQAMNVPMQDMRAPDFGDLTLSIFDDLKRILRHRDGRGHDLSPPPATRRAGRPRVTTTRLQTRGDKRSDGALRAVLDPLGRRWPSAWA